MERDGVRIKGLKELDRALGKADRELRRKLRTDLKAIAGIVAVGARAKAESKGLKQSGDLIRGIKPFALTGRAGVRSNAMHRGYNYPGRLEYEKGGRNATLYPAYEEAKPLIYAKTEHLIDQFVNDASGGPTA